MKSYIKPPKTQHTNNEHMHFGFALEFNGSTMIVGAASDSSCASGVTNSSTVPSAFGCAQSGAGHVYRSTDDGYTWAYDAFLKANVNRTNLYSFRLTVGILGDKILGPSVSDGNSTTGTQYGVPIVDADTGLGQGAISIFTPE